MDNILLAWKRLSVVFCILLFLLSGCTYSSINLIRAKGGELKANYQLINSASGKDVSITAFRQMFATTEKFLTVPTVPDLPGFSEDMTKVEIKN